MLWLMKMTGTTQGQAAIVSGGHLAKLVRPSGQLTEQDWPHSHVPSVTLRAGA
jgi:hypothetical protein